MGFLPDTLAEWVGLLGAATALLTVYWAAMLRFIRAPLIAAAERDRERIEERFSQHGKRIGDVESEQKVIDTKLDGLERMMERVDGKLANILENLGRHDARTERWLASGERHQREWLEENRKIEGRLSSVEAVNRLFEPAIRALPALLANRQQGSGQ